MPRLIAFLVVSTLAGASAAEAIGLVRDEIKLDTTTGVTADEIHTSISLTLDHAFDEHWHLIGGPVWERFELSDLAPSLPSTLQFAAARVGVEYRIKDDPAFSLSIQPGRYGDGRLANGVFDIPVTLETGYPLNDDWFLVGGFYYSRLSSFSLEPIAGVVAELTPQWEMQLVFPDSKLSYRPNDKTTYSLFEELLDNGYQLSDRRRVEYYQCHAGVSWEQDFPGGWSVSTKAGWALARTLDFYKERRTAHPGSKPFLEIGLSKKW
jgi:hypothetical protein